MEICSADHEEIIHDQRNCPICEQIKDLNETVVGLGDELTEARDEVSALQNDLKEAAKDGPGN